MTAGKARQMISEWTEESIIAMEEVGFPFLDAHEPTENVKQIHVKTLKELENEG